MLLSHSDPAHLGALPYLVGKRKLQAPIYATVPVQRMGQMFLYDQFLSRWQTSDFSAFSLDDVDAAFQRIRQVKFQQQVKLTGADDCANSWAEPVLVPLVFIASLCSKKVCGCFLSAYWEICYKQYPSFAHGKMPGICSGHASSPQYKSGHS